MRRLRFRLSLALLTLFALSLGACGGCGGGEDEASIEERLQEKGTMEVMEEAGKAKYDPPDDGRLSERQVEEFIEIEERAAKIRQVAQKKLEEQSAGAESEDDKASVWSQVRNMGAAMQGFGDLMTAELRAAQELGYNPAEFQWVRGKILEAQAAAAGRQFQEGMGEAQKQLLATMEAQREQVTDPDQRAALDEQIETFRDNLASAESDGEVDPGVEFNVELVQRYEEQIRAAFQATEEGA